MRFEPIFVPALMLAIWAMPDAAAADVLEINHGEAKWVAGGQAEQATPTQVFAGEAPAEFAYDPHPKSLTRISEAAGPERWRDRVAELAAKYDISPTLLEALVWQESRWNVSAVSPAGARGLAQLMPGTARMMGVNPDDPHANLEGGARYLRLQLDAFDGDLEKALAAYNAGPGRVIRAGGIPAIRETRDYVTAILSRLTQPVRE